MARLSWWCHCMAFTSMIFFFTMLAALLVVACMLNEPAYNSNTTKLLTDVVARTDCEAEIALGNTGCIKKFYDSNAWKTWPWWCIWFTPIVMILVAMSFVIYLGFPNFVTSIILILGIAGGLVWLIVAIISNTVFWVKCSHYSFCRPPVETFDWTKSVTNSHDFAPEWIAYNVFTYLLAISLVLIFVYVIMSQFCLAREKTKETINDPNRSTLTPFHVKSTIGTDVEGGQRSAASMSTSSLMPQVGRAQISSIVGKSD